MNQDVISVLQLNRKKVVGIYDSIEKVNHGIISKINYPEDWLIRVKCKSNSIYHMIFKLSRFY